MAAAIASEFCSTLRTGANRNAFRYEMKSCPLLPAPFGFLSDAATSVSAISFRKEKLSCKSSSSSSLPLWLYPNASPQKVSLAVTKTQLSHERIALEECLPAHNGSGSGHLLHQRITADYMQKYHQCWGLAQTSFCDCNLPCSLHALSH